MTEEQIEHIKTLLAHEDSSFVQQGLTLLETEITAAETLCAFFGIEAPDGFDPIAEQIVEWTHSSMVVAWIEQFAVQHDIGFIKSRSRHYRIRINRGWQLTYRMTELTRKGYEFWSQSDYNLDEYLMRFDDGTKDAFDVPAEANFCTEDNCDDGWETDYSFSPNLEYENLPIEIQERFRGETLASIYSGKLFDLADKGSDITIPPKMTYTEIVDSTPISDDDTFIIINYQSWRPGLGYFLDIHTESSFDFAKLLVKPKFSTLLGATTIDSYSSVEYDDVEFEIELDGTMLERSRTYCKRIASPRTRWELYSRS